MAKKTLIQRIEDVLPAMALAAEEDPAFEPFVARLLREYDLLTASDDPVARMRARLGIGRAA